MESVNSSPEFQHKFQPINAFTYVTENQPITQISISQGHIFCTSATGQLWKRAIADLGTEKPPSQFLEKKILLQESDIQLLPTNNNDRGSPAFTIRRVRKDPEQTISKTQKLVGIALLPPSSNPKFEGRDIVVLTEGDLTFYSLNGKLFHPIDKQLRGAHKVFILPSSDHSNSSFLLAYAINDIIKLGSCNPNFGGFSRILDHQSTTEKPKFLMPLGNSFLSACGATLFFWRENGDDKNPFRIKLTSPITSLAPSLEKNQFAIGTKDGEIAIWNLSANPKFPILPDKKRTYHTSLPVYNLTFLNISEEGPTLAYIPKAPISLLNSEFTSIGTSEGVEGPIVIKDCAQETDQVIAGKYTTLTRFKTSILVAGTFLGSVEFFKLTTPTQRDINARTTSLVLPPLKLSRKNKLKRLFQSTSELNSDSPPSPRHTGSILSSKEPPKVIESLRKPQPPRQRSSTDSSLRSNRPPLPSKTYSSPSLRATPSSPQPILPPRPPSSPQPPSSPRTLPSHSSSQATSRSQSPQSTSSSLGSSRQKQPASPRSLPPSTQSPSSPLRGGAKRARSATTGKLQSRIAMFEGK